MIERLIALLALLHCTSHDKVVLAVLVEVFIALAAVQSGLLELVLLSGLVELYRLHQNGLLPAVLKVVSLPCVQ